MAENTHPLHRHASWSAVLSMTLCVSMLISSEFMPVSLLTPIAHGLHVPPGQTGQAISASGFSAMVAALLTSTLIGTLNRKHVLLGMTVCMACSLIMIALASNMAAFITARILLGVSIGGFWSLATSILMRLVPSQDVSKALSIMYMGQALATAFAAPIGSYLETLVGWRGVFWLLVPVVFINLAWQFISLPSLPSSERISHKTFLFLCRKRYFVKGMFCMALTFGGAFTMFTYLRPYLEQKLHLNVTHITLFFLALGCTGFLGGLFGGKMAQNHVMMLLKIVPATMGTITLGLIFSQDLPTCVIILLGLWGIMNTSLSIGWMGWMSQNIDDYPEAAGSLMVAVIQGSILFGSAIGGSLLERAGIVTTFSCSVVLSFLAFIMIGSGRTLLKTS